MAIRTTNRFSPEVRSRRVGLVMDHEQEHASLWAATFSIATKIGCAALTLSQWVKKAEIDGGRKPGLTMPAGAS